jgi:hypothetical protein
MSDTPTAPELLSKLRRQIDDEEIAGHFPRELLMQIDDSLKKESIYVVVLLNGANPPEHVPCPSLDTAVELFLEHAAEGERDPRICVREGETLVPVARSAKASEAVTDCVTTALAEAHEQLGALLRDDAGSGVERCRAHEVGMALHAVTMAMPIFDITPGEVL